jgi:phosphocarrier protein FPr
MVGIVLVSHSRELSAAVKALAEQQIQARARLAAVGGSDNPHQPYGTDPVAIAEAIQSVFAEDGVLVLMDLGSAVISGRVALDLLEPEQAARVHLSVGPFVEGALAAAVQASIGMDLAAVAREAEEAMQAKRAVLLHEEEEPASPLSQATSDSEHQASADVIVVNPAGLHFGPAARFIQEAARFRASITVLNLTTDVGPADASRFNQLLSLGVEKNHRIRISAAGPDAAEALGALVSLVAHDVGEGGEKASFAGTTPDAAPIAGAGRSLLQGLPTSPGVAVGTAFVLAATQDPLQTPRTQPAGPFSPDREWAEFTAAQATALHQVHDLARQVHDTLGEGQSLIFQAQALLLDDEDLHAAVRQHIYRRALPCAEAVRQATLAWAQRFRAMSGDLFRQRAADVEDVGRRLLRILGHEEELDLDLPADAIVVAHDLLPSQTATLDRSRVVGFCTAGGGPTAHTAILARSMGIPAITGIGPTLLEEVRRGATLAIDGGHGRIIVEPDAATLEAYHAAQAAAVAARAAAWAAARALTRTRDGVRVEVVANLAAPADVELALAAGAEGVGLLRTEFLFQDRQAPPGEDEQVAVYGQVVRGMGRRPVVIRTMDIGGDKPAPFLMLPHEANPFLGWRAIRISLAMPELFKTQLRALLRAAVHGDLHIMFPMIATVDEVLHAQALLAESAAELAAAGVPHRADVPVGIMIEVPAAVAAADHLAGLVDFFSIGTNDLTQYVFAADRTNSRVAALADPLHPALLRQVDAVLSAAHAHGIRVGLCGELAAHAEAIPILLGLGLDEFSMAPASIPAAKQVLSRLTVPAARRLAQKVLQMNDGAAVRSLVREMLQP